MGEDSIDERTQPIDGIVVEVGDRVVRQVTARHHEGAPDSLQQ